MKHVRMLGLCLIAIFAMSVIAAGPAQAIKYSTKTWTQFKYCPYLDKEAEATGCMFGETSGGPNGGFFQLGRVRVPLAKPVIIQGAFAEEAAPGEEGSHKVLPATNGGETLESPELKVPGGLKMITATVQKQAGWPQSLIESFKEAVANKETALKVKIELAGGNQLFENPNALNTNNLLNRAGNTFELPLKVRMINPWLTKLGGGPCTVGNEAHPIVQDLTSGGAGTPGELHFNSGFSMIEIQNSRLVDFNWPVEEGAAAGGCGGAYESYVDDAINRLLEIPGSAGFTVLQGTLFTAARPAVASELTYGNEEHREEFEH